MGNYHKGNIRFILRKDLPEFIIDALLFIQDKDFKMPKKYSGIDIFNEENRNKVNIGFSAIIDNIDNTMFIDKDNYNNIGDKWYDFFKNYIDISLSEEYFTLKGDNLLDRIYDEDCTYDKSYFLEA